MSSEITFNGTTLWSSTAGGINSPRVDLAGKNVIRQMEPLPQGYGFESIQTGTDPGGVSISADLLISDADAATLETTLSGAYDDFGTVAYPGGSLANCQMISWGLSRGASTTVIAPAASAGAKRYFTLTATFKALR